VRGNNAEDALHTELKDKCSGGDDGKRASKGPWQERDGADRWREQRGLSGDGRCVGRARRCTVHRG
jgi:hypothetical protein